MRMIPFETNDGVAYVNPSEVSATFLTTSPGFDGLLVVAVQTSGGVTLTSPTHATPEEARIAMGSFIRTLNCELGGSEDAKYEDEFLRAEYDFLQKVLKPVLLCNTDDGIALDFGEEHIVGGHDVAIRCFDAVKAAQEIYNGVRKEQ